MKAAFVHDHIFVYNPKTNLYYDGQVDLMLLADGETSISLPIAVLLHDSLRRASFCGSVLSGEWHSRSGILDL